MSNQNPRKSKQRYVPAIGPRLRKVLFTVFALFALLGVNSAYLGGITLAEYFTGQTLQDWFYMNMFILHLVLGVLVLLPFIIFGILHIRNARNRPNRRAVRVGYALFAVGVILLSSGMVLTRLEGIFAVNDPTVRTIAYWAHIITPFLAIWLFVLHRLAGKRIQWKIGLRWAGVAAAFGGVMVIWQMQDPRQWNMIGPESGEKYFFPSLARTASGSFIPEKVLNNDPYCMDCHQDSHKGWLNSVHHFSSFNNPPYLFSVRETRRVALEKDGDVHAARFCAGCHDPVVFFSGKFDDPEFDDVHDSASQAGITCTSCHAITHVNSVKGNSDYTIEEPVHYPFAFSDAPVLKWLNHQLIKAKPALHKKTFLKPLHQSPEFCGSCHKVHLPPELNDYKWLRGQNHFDAYHLSGVSGHGITSFYYPKMAKNNCNECHMPLKPSTQFGARDFDGSGLTKIHDHMFPSANTAIPHMLGLPDWVNEAHRKFNEGVMRLDIFGLREGGAIDGSQVAPLRPDIPVLEPGKTYLVDIVIRTQKMGHVFTQGTSDSNEIWLDVLVKAGDRVIGRSGGLGPDNRVDPWSHFVNTYMLDRDGNRIDRRNAQDIFVPLYSHQIPPGAADTVHFSLQVPKEIQEPVTVEARLQFRKFDTTYMKHVHGEDFVNDLPIMTLAEDRVVLSVTGGETMEAQPYATDEWVRWNDYGIGLLRKGGKTKGELRQAEQAFYRVEELGRPDGPLNRARVYLKQGTVQDKAIEALQKATTFDPPAPKWSVAWFTGMVNKQNGFLDEAIANFKSIIELDDEETRSRGFDFSQDYRLLVELGQTLFERSKLARDEASREEKERLLNEAIHYLDRALELNPENASAHYNAMLVRRQLGETDAAGVHLGYYQTYRPDFNARDHAVAKARMDNPAANHAAEAIVIYDLNRAEAFEKDSPARRAYDYELRPLEESDDQAVEASARTEGETLSGRPAL